jgi:hypothetical protein
MPIGELTPGQAKRLLDDWEKWTADRAVTPREREIICELCVRAAKQTVMGKSSTH